MNKDVFTIVKKEFTRFFGDKRLFFSSVIMPGLLIFVMYSIMGKGLMKSFSVSDDYISKIYVENMPEELNDNFNALGTDITEITDEQVDESKALLLDDGSDKIDAIIVFPQDFINVVNSYEISDGKDAPNVKIFYNSANNKSSRIYSLIVSILDEYEASISNKFDINKLAEDESYDQATEKETTGMLFSMIMPMLLLIFLFTGCMSIAPDAIAGEKERGTIATLLVTPVKRSSIALGKIISLSVFSLLSGISSFLGTMLSMPALMGGNTEGLNASVYSAKDYILLFLIIISTVLMFVSILAVVSAFAKSVKEAGTLVLPFMLLIIGIGLSSMMGGGSSMTALDSVIPIYGTVKCLSGIFAFNYNIAYIFIAVGMNIAVTCALTYVLTKMFNNEKIMF